MPATAHLARGRGTAEVFVSRPLEEVFDYLTDLGRMTTWWPEHSTYRRIRGDGGPGSIYFWMNSFGAFSLPGLTYVYTRERPARFTYRVVAPGLTVRMDYRFSAVATGTRIDLEVRSPILWLHLASGNFAEGVTRSLDRLASLLARPAGPASLAP